MKPGDLSRVQKLLHRLSKTNASVDVKRKMLHVLKLFGNILQENACRFVSAQDRPPFAECSMNLAISKFWCYNANALEKSGFTQAIPKKV